MVFSSYCWTQETEEVRVEFGRWTEKVKLGELSNFREAGNLVVCIMRMVATCQIPNGLEVFVFMNNKVMESTYLRGSSKSSKLHNFIVQLQNLEMEGKFIIHFIWIAGKRMIDQGTDVLPQGEDLTGSISAKKFLTLLPLNETAFE